MDSGCTLDLVLLEGLKSYGWGVPGTHLLRASFWSRYVLR